MSKERAAQLVDAGIWLKLSGDVEGARRLFERALKLDPENTRAVELLARPATEVVPPPMQSSPSNPFEREPKAAGAGELDWGAATGFQGFESPDTTVPVSRAELEPLVTLSDPARAPEDTVAAAPKVSSNSGLSDDWGRATGVDSPVPQVAPVVSADALHAAPPPGLKRQTLPFASSGSSEAPAPTSSSPSGGRRATMPFASSPSGTGAGSAPTPVPARSTLPFAGGAPAAPRQTLMYASADGGAKDLLGPPAAGPPRSTLTFSPTPFAAPTGEPEPVSPVVVRLGADEDGPSGEVPSVVDRLKAEVDAKRSSPSGIRSAPKGVFDQPQVPPQLEISLDPPDPLVPTSIVITDRAPEPSPPRATPPMFTEPEPPPPEPEPVAKASQPASAPSGAPASADERPPAGAGDAWNWSATDAGPVSFNLDAPEPHPSPTLSPQASSAWDQRSNPGISLSDLPPSAPLEFVTSSPSKVARAAEAKRDEVAVLVRGAKDLIELDDHTGAMELINKALAIAPDDPDVKQLQDRSERTLLAMFESKLGNLDKLPRVLLKDDEIIWLNLDHRAGFVLAQIDGAMSFEDLFAVSGMSRIDTARILAQLVDEGVISRG